MWYHSNLQLCWPNHPKQKSVRGRNILFKVTKATLLTYLFFSIGEAIQGAHKKNSKLKKQLALYCLFRIWDWIPKANQQFQQVISRDYIWNWPILHCVLADTLQLQTHSSVLHRSSGVGKNTLHWNIPNISSSCTDNSIKLCQVHKHHSAFWTIPKYNSKNTGVQRVTCTDQAAGNLSLIHKSN